VKPKQLAAVFNLYASRCGGAYLGVENSFRPVELIKAGLRIDR
jgi:hypothetical protein